MREKKEEDGGEPVEVMKNKWTDFTCRLCLFNHKDNFLLVAGTNIDLVQKISKHLSIQVKDGDFPIWICKYCQQSIESFHEFHSKVKQIHESLYSLLSAMRSKKNHREITCLADELAIIETTVGFARSKKSRPRSTQRKSETKTETVRRTSTRCRNRKKYDDQEHLVKVASQESGDSCLYLGEKYDGASSQSTQPEISEIAEVVIESEKIPEEKCTAVLKSALESGCQENTAAKDDDLSSLEDQDWVGQGLSFDVDSDDDRTWKPSSKSNAKGRSNRKRKSNCPIDEESMAFDKLDESDNDPGSPETKKVKLRITATHGTEPKPKVPPEVRKMLREEMNARFVDFYGITCDICMTNIHNNAIPIEPEKYKSFEELSAHMQSAHNVRGYVKCCNCTMRERKRAEKHMLLHTEPGSIFKCNICGKQLSSQQSFRCHILLHLPDAERPFHCNVCDRGFVSKADLSSHERQHLPDDKRLVYTCDVCGSRFSYETGLLIHKQRVHENIRPYLCDLCAKSFSGRGDMERHRAQIHGNVKREQCPDCGKWFKGPSILRVHMQRHKGAQYKCHVCDKTYSVRSSLRAHLLRHTDEKPHKCPICEKSFKLTGTLKMHLNQHTGDLPYSCQFCPKKFASSGNYYTHRKRMHADQVARIKEATQAALEANGLPPETSIPPPTVTQSMSEAIARTKEIVAAKAKEMASQVPQPNAATENVGSCMLNPMMNAVERTSTVPSQTQRMQQSEPAGSMSLFVPQRNSGSVLLVQSGGGTPVGTGSIDVGSKLMRVIPNVKFSSGPNPGTLMAGNLKLVQMISPDGTAKLVFMKDDSLIMGSAPGKISAVISQPPQISNSTISRENMNADASTSVATVVQ